MRNAWLGSDKYQFLSNWFDLTRVRTDDIQMPQASKMGDGHSTHSAIRSGPPNKMLWHAVKIIPKEISFRQHLENALMNQ